MRVARRNLQNAYESLARRQRRGEIDQAALDDLLAQYARSQAAKLDLRSVPAGAAWDLAEIHRTARSWPEAERLYRIVLERAKSDDRRLHARLRLALVRARQGDVDEAIGFARQAMATPPEGRAPILPAVLYEIVPAAQGQGRDSELARLLREAMALHQTAVVDPWSDAGRAFLIARPRHLRLAAELALRLERG